MIEIVKGHVYNLTSRCRECPLGQRGDCRLKMKTGLRRTNGSGPYDASVMLVAEAPRDSVERRGPFGLLSLANPYLESGFLPWVDPVLAAVESIGLDVESLYMTTAIKCAVQGKGMEIPNYITHTCLDHHLGPELELIQPGVIWLFGHYSLKMIQSHLKGCNVPDIKPGDATVVDAPSSWRFEKLLIVRSHHPARVKTGVGSYEDLKSSVELVKTYVEEGYVR